MQISIVEYLERATGLWPDRTVYQDEQEVITFSELMDECNRIGTALCRVTPSGKPVIVLAAKSVHVASLYLGVAAAGCFYVPLEAELPAYRLKIIFDLVQTELVLTDVGVVLPDELGYTGQIMNIRECLESEVDAALLRERREKQMDIDPLYVIFTSGSSGIPKGVVASHRNVIGYIDTFAETFSINEKDVFGNQSSLSYVAALRDLYLPLRTGAKTVLLPKSLFSQPGKLFQIINQYEITTLCWVASALSICAELGISPQTAPLSVRRVFFTGSVLPGRHLRIWQESLPEVIFVNHYGSTEITASCTYYIVDHKVSDDESIPIGVPFRNTDILLLDGESRLVPDGEIGEICVRGAGLALGYFGDSEKTCEAFVRNPVGPHVNELIYKTGDLGKKQPDGNYTFHGRKDSQIKHMGHRIELSEIDAAALSLSGLKDVCCLYKPENDMIWMFYTGTVSNKELALHLRERLPGFMVPRKFVHLDEFPQGPGGKVDSNTLRKQME